MMSDQIRNIIRETVMVMIKDSSSEDNINRLAKKHREKVHFVPAQYRILGGILQGLNIKFGNFIESLMANIITFDPNVKIMPDSGEKILLEMTSETERLIDQYISDREQPDSPDDCTPMFDDLLQKIVETENSADSEVKKRRNRKDADALFKTRDGLIVFTELKYNDDHDTGKFPNINRKFIKTWAGLVNRLNIVDPNDLFPVLYYFNPTKRWGAIYTPSRNVMRGPQLFENFFVTKYEDVDRYLRAISEDPEIIKMFDDLYQRIRNKPLQNQDRLL